MLDPTLRLAGLDEADAIDALMKASTRDLFVSTGNADVLMPDGQRLACVAMEKPISVD
jgi:hypothetical protein